MFKVTTTTHPNDARTFLDIESAYKHAESCVEFGHNVEVKVYTSGKVKTFDWRKFHQFVKLFREG